MKQKQNTPPSSIEEGDEVELLLKTTATILCFVFEGNSLRNKKKRAATGFGNETANAREAIFIAWAGHAIFDRLGNSGRKDPDTMFTRKKDPDPKPPFSKDPLSGAFSKSSVLGPERFQKAPDTCGYV